MTAPPLSRRARALELIEIATIGLPFCAFKLIVGDHLRASLPIVGWALLALGVADVAFNLINALTVTVAGRRRLPVCSLQAAMLTVRKSPRAREVGTALDTLLSFTLVATMIAAGALPSLTPSAGAYWNVAVILNVLGAGVLRLFNALASGKDAGTAPGA